MQDALQNASKQWQWGFAASVLLHLAVALLLIVRLPSLAEPQSEQAINVELVPPEPPEPPAPPEPKQDKPTPAPQPAKPRPQAFESALAEQKSEQKPEKPETDTQKPSEPEQKEAMQELQTEGAAAASSKADKPVTRPAKAPTAKPEAEKLTEARKLYAKDSLADPRVKQALGKLPPRERIIQICNIEALEQIRHHRPGTFPDMLARSSGSVSETGLSVSDGAFRSHAQWYAIAYKCEIDTATMAVAAFSYNIGAAIPQNQWVPRQLPRD